MDDDYVHDLMDECGCNRYPQEFLSDYEPFECLASNEACETLLVKNKRTGMFYVAKCYVNGHAIGHATESEILKKMQRAGLPRFVDEYKNDAMLCVIREYVEGTPLHEWAGQKQPDAASAVRIALALCDLLIYLHGQAPPIIHRDIKPQNLILGADGQLWLIDFGISRLYQEESEADTACWGTQDFAAPEQYGYAQTDVRSDIYSFGILLGWLLTGEVKREGALLQIADRRLGKIVGKCTAFAPGERYASAAKVRADLVALGGHRRRRTIAQLGVAMLCVLCLCAGFAIGRFTEFLTPAQGAGIVFAEPLIEQAVRLMLHLDDGVPISQTDLLSVTELFIYGNRPLQNGEAFQALTQQTDGTKLAINGGITTLSDVAMMPNLSVLILPIQNVTDLSPLTELTALRHLDLRHNPVSDVAPLAQMTQLTMIGLFGTRVADLSPLAACPLLKELDVGGSFVTSLASLGSNDTMTILKLNKAPLQTLDGVQNLPKLTQIELTQVADGDLTPLLLAPNLQLVTLYETLKSIAQSTLGEATFTIEYQQN